MAIQVNRLSSCLYGILLGCAISIPPGVLLVIIYALCLVDPSDPDYYGFKLRMMFHMPDPGVLSWLGVVGLLIGFSLTLIRGIQPFLGYRSVDLPRDYPEDSRVVLDQFQPTDLLSRTDEERITHTHPEGEFKEGRRNSVNYSTEGERRREKGSEKGPKLDEHDR